MLPTTTSRVEENTAAEANERIRLRTEDSIYYHAEHLDEIERRLDELDAEWDIERTLEANAATLGLAGIALGAFVDRRWLLFPAAISGFLLQHALQGWCPPIVLFRKQGVRTSTEIDRERYALKALRGDFASVAEYETMGHDEKVRRVLATLR